MASIRFNFSVSVLPLLVLAGGIPAYHAVWGQDLRPTAVGDRDTAELIEVDKGPPVATYQRMTYQGLTIEVPPVWKRVPMALQTAGPDALRELERRTRLSTNYKNMRPLVLPDELVGMPAIVTRSRIAAPWEVRLVINKPSRVYAFVNFDLTEDPDIERESWSLYRRGAEDAMALYYRDFPAGEQTARFDADVFIGAGVRPLGLLSPQEKLIAVARLINGRPVTEITSEFDEPVSAKLQWQLRDLSGDAPQFEGHDTLRLAPHQKQRFDIESDRIREGVLYRLQASVMAAGVTKVTSVPVGRFPVPPDDSSVEEPLIPYGGYFKTTVSDDRELRDVFYRAMFYKLRRVHMNACVLDTGDQ